MSLRAQDDNSLCTNAQSEIAGVNSDLKNTYGAVNVDRQGEKVATGMPFVGFTIGDYSKSTINTSIFTGKTIGVCSMLYGLVTTNVPSYVNYARLSAKSPNCRPR